MQFYSAISGIFFFLVYNDIALNFTIGVFSAVTSGLYNNISDKNRCILRGLSKHINNIM